MTVFLEKTAFLCNKKCFLFYSSPIIDLLGQNDKGLGEKNPYKITGIKIVEYE